MRFAKAHAYGNDFLYVRDHLATGLDRAELARQMCNRQSGVGADGLIFYQPTTSGATMQLINADGSRAEVSGNGVRALGALLLAHRDQGLAAHGRGVAEQVQLVIETEAGRKVLDRLTIDGTRQVFRAHMGHPADIRQVTLEAAGETVTLAVLNMGNPQCVLLGPLPDEDRFRRLGAALEKHAAFPEGTNVEFAHVETPERVRILIWERGVGPTRSSGTGSCAAAVAAAAYGGASRATEVCAPGGDQTVSWLESGVELTGWAEVTCEGDWVRILPRG